MGWYASYVIELMEKILIGHTSVWNKYAILKKGSLTEYNSFDMTKMGNVYVYGANDIFVKCRRKLVLSQHKLAKYVGAKDIAKYESSSRGVPLNLLTKIAKLLGTDLNNLLSSCQNLKFSYGGNEVPIIMPHNPSEAIEIIRNVKPISSTNSNFMISIKEIPFSLKDSKVLQNKRKRLYGYSKILWKFLTTFYSYEKEPALQLPLSNLTKELIEGQVTLKYVAASLLLAEGSRNRKGFDFSNKSKVLHDLLVDSIFYEYGVLPTTYFNYVGDVHRTFYSTNVLGVRKDIEDEFGCLKTSPKGDTESYLKQFQPRLEGLKKRVDMEMATRIFASTEGCVSFTVIPQNKKLGEYTVSPKIHISCAHPKILLDIHKILTSLGFVPHLTEGNTWSGWCGLRLSALIDVIKFLDMGGFIPGVKVARSDSNFCGVEKQKLLLSIIELRKRLSRDKGFRKKLDLKTAKNALFGIIQNNHCEADSGHYGSLIGRMNKRKNFKHSTTKFQKLEGDVNLMLYSPKEYLIRLKGASRQPGRIICSGPRRKQRNARRQ